MSFGAVLGICLLTPVFAGDGREDNVGVETASGVVAGLEEKKRADGKRGLGEALGFAEKRGLMGRADLVRGLTLTRNRGDWETGGTVLEYRHGF